jgi:hypothetical protein
VRRQNSPVAVGRVFPPAWLPRVGPALRKHSQSSSSSPAARQVTVPSLPALRLPQCRVKAARTTLSLRRAPITLLVASRMDTLRCQCRHTRIDSSVSLSSAHWVLLCTSESTASGSGPALASTKCPRHGLDSCSHHYECFSPCTLAGLALIPASRPAHSRLVRRVTPGPRPQRPRAHRAPQQRAPRTTTPSIPSTTCGDTASTLTWTRRCGVTRGVEALAAR